MFDPHAEVNALLAAKDTEIFALIEQRDFAIREVEQVARENEFLKKLIEHQEKTIATYEEANRNE